MGWLIAILVAGGRTATFVDAGATLVLTVVEGRMPEDQPPVAGTVIWGTGAEGGEEGVTVGAIAGIIGCCLGALSWMWPAVEGTAFDLGLLLGTTVLELHPWVAGGFTTTLTFLCTGLITAAVSELHPPVAALAGGIGSAGLATGSNAGSTF